MPKFSLIAGELLKARYYQNGEDWEELCRRVAKTIAGVEKTKELRKKWEITFFNMLYTLEFLPNSPVLWGAGFQKKTLSACFVIPVEDNYESIFDAVKRAGMIYKAGGGVGINYSKLRPKNSSISAGGSASGPVVFLLLWDIAGEVTKQGGKRRSAHMSILHCGHPDIRDFILAKSEPGMLTNMNLSVAITNDFMKKATSDKSEWDLVFHNQTIKDDAKELLYLISQKAWESGEPGVIFLDRMNEDNSCPKVAKIKGTNPCSEQPLRPNESCTLGSINLDKFVDENGIFDIGGFEECIYNATRFLDNTIEANYFPDDLIDNATKKTRPIGLGLMGLADYLIKRRVVYGSDESLGEIEFLCKVLHRETVKASALLGEEKGSFPAFRKSKFCKKHKAMRNSQHNTIAPTGTISIIAGCSSGIEPYYSFASIQRSVAGFDHDVIIDSKYKYILQSGIEEWKNVLISGQEITADKHIKVLATAQKYIDTGISKTISLPEEATVEDVRDTFILAWQLGCKGVTVFRERNKNRQALLKEVCPDHKVPLVPSGRCMVCPVCGFSNRCSIG